MKVFKEKQADGRQVDESGIYTKIRRTHYSKKIISLLENVIKNFENIVDTISDISILFDVLLDFRKTGYNDPFHSFISALYDGLSDSQKWSSLKKSDYTTIFSLIKKLNNKASLNYSDTDKALAELEALGLDTSPY